MKKFFLVINKEKIYAYVVSILTVITLFFMSGMIGSQFNETESTASNIVENNIEVNEVDNSVYDN